MTLNELNLIGTRSTAINPVAILAQSVIAGYYQSSYI
jgi:hypothetical protein